MPQTEKIGSRTATKMSDPVVGLAAVVAVADAVEANGSMVDIAHHPML